MKELDYIIEDYADLSYKVPYQGTATETQAVAQEIVRCVGKPVTQIPYANFWRVSDIPELMYLNGHYGLGVSLEETFKKYPPKKTVLLVKEDNETGLENGDILRTMYCRVIVLGEGVQPTNTVVEKLVDAVLEQERKEEHELLTVMKSNSMTKKSRVSL